MPDVSSELAEDLAKLKSRSRRSDDALTQRTGLSRSSLHRYCTGALVPDTFGPIEGIGRACKATSAELDRLYRLWSLARAVAAQEKEPRGTTDDVPSLPEGSTPAVGDESTTASASKGRGETWVTTIPIIEAEHPVAA